MIETNSQEFMTAIIFATSMIVLVVGMIVFVFVASGRRLGRKEEKLKALAARLSVVEEEERKRIAEDLHACIGEIMVISSRNIRELRQINASPEINRGLDEIIRLIEKFTEGARSLVFDLTPSELYDFGLSAAVETLASEFRREHRMVVRVEDFLLENSPDQEIGIFLYKAVQEFIRNARRHGGADEILITLRQKTQFIEITVEDNGSGFVAGSDNFVLKTDSGFGLFNVKNRAEIYGGGLRTAASGGLDGGRVSVWARMAPIKTNGKMQAPLAGRSV